MRSRAFFGSGDFRSFIGLLPNQYRCRKTPGTDGILGRRLESEDCRFQRRRRPMGYVQAGPPPRCRPGSPGSQKKGHDRSLNARAPVTSPLSHNPLGAPCVAAAAR